MDSQQNSIIYSKRVTTNPLILQEKNEKETKGAFPNSFNAASITLKVS